MSEISKAMAKRLRYLLSKAGYKELVLHLQDLGGFGSEIQAFNHISDNEDNLSFSTKVALNDVAVRSTLSKITFREEK